MRTLGFSLLASDADGDATRLALIHDSTTPAGVNFDPNTGYFEWTPDQSVVNNSTDNSKAFTFTFSANDGVATTQQTVQVRVFDVNRIPSLIASNHAMLVGQAFSLPVQLGGTSTSGAIVANDADDVQGSTNTQSSHYAPGVRRNS